MLIKNTISPIGEYIKKYSSTVIRCPNELAAKSLSDHLHSKGYKWTTGEKIQNNTKWGKFKENSVYIINSFTKIIALSNITKRVDIIYAKKKV